ncbi:MAG: hypothetical protein RJQ09_00180 [Cyclobacteriaceae bacterium]
MTRLIAFSVLIFLGFGSIAQREFASIQLPYKNINSYWVVPDGTGGVCIQYFKKPYLYFDIISSSGEKLAQIKEPFKYSPEVVGGTFSGGSYRFYYKPRKVKKEGGLAVMVVDIHEQSFKGFDNYFLKSSNAEELIGRIEMGSDFLTIHNIRGSGLIRTTILRDKEPLKNDFTVPASISHAFNNSDPIVLIDPIAPKSIYGMQWSKKLYYTDDEIIFTFDLKDQFKTFIWKINPRLGTSELKTIPGEKMVFGKGYNSFLFKNHLYRWTVDDVKIDLTVYDLRTEKAVQNFNHNGEALISFKSGPPILIDEFGTIQRLTDIRNEKLFKTFSNGNASVFVDQINRNNVKVTMGAFNQSSTGLTIGGGFGSFGGRGGVALGGSKQLTGTRRGSTFIESFLNSPGLEPVKNDGFLTLNERIIKFFRNRGVDVYNSNAIAYDYADDIVHVAYIDRGVEQLKIVEFIK